MLILRSPDSRQIIVFNKRHDITTRDTYSMTDSTSGQPVAVVDRVSGDVVTKQLFRLAGQGWQTQFAPDRGHPKPAPRAANAPPSDYPQSPNG